MFAPLGLRGTRTVDVLRGADIGGEVEIDEVESIDALCEALPAGTGALLLAEELLGQREIDLLRRAVEAQPAWSDLPLLIVLSTRAGEKRIEDVLQRLGPRANVLLLDPGAREEALLTAVRSALRSRRRQYQGRDLMQERWAEPAGSAAQDERIDAMVRQRTAGLERDHQARRQSERLAALGTLSAGLGHDMGNIIFPLRVRLDLMESRRGLTRTFRDDISALRNAIDHLQRLSVGLRQLARDPGETGLAAASTALPQWWHDAQPVLKNALPHGADLSFSAPQDLPPLAIESHSLTQIVFHLVQNAGEAFVACRHQRGRVDIRAERASDESVRLRIMDNGPGMSDEVRTRCLEPFFTTKVRGISTGLGLALAHGIVQRSGGTVDLSSKADRGTAWTITLPVSRVRASHGHPPEAGVTVDDQRLAGFVRSLLVSLGYSLCPGKPMRSNAPLWVTDRPAGVAGFLKQHPGGRVLVLQPHDAGEDRRICALGARPPAMRIRTALHELARTGQWPATAGQLAGGRRA